MILLVVLTDEMEWGVQEAAALTETLYVDGLIDDRAATFSQMLNEMGVASLS